MMARGQRNRFAGLFGRGIRAAAPTANTVVAFPEAGLLRLERLARELRESFERYGSIDALFAFDMIGGHRPRLRVDESACVTWNSDDNAYHVVIVSTPDTRITLDSSDFATVERFVRLYVVGRLTEHAEGAMFS